MPAEHNTAIVENPHAGNSAYKFVAKCSCQFEALAHTADGATSYLKSHLFRHGIDPAKAAVLKVEEEVKPVAAVVKAVGVAVAEDVAAQTVASKIPVLKG